MSVSKEFVGAINSAGKRKTKPLDTPATVTRIEGKTAWVRYPDSLSDTPVDLTIAAKKGDTVQVRAADGRAWIVGNSTAPPTDDTTAKKAQKEANKAYKLAKTTKESVATLQGDVDEASENAEIALQSANGKNTIYHSATAPSGGEYKINDIWFDSANGYQMHRWNGTSWVAEQWGNEAIADASITNAKIANATIQDAKISTVDVGKLTGGFIDASHIDASSITIGESQVTNLTTDLASKASSADVANAAKTASNYITYINGRSGICIHDSGDTSNYANINSYGMNVYKGGSLVAEFGAYSVLYSGAQYFQLSGNGMSYFNGSTTAFSVTSSGSGLFRGALEVYGQSSLTSINCTSIYASSSITASGDIGAGGDINSEGVIYAKTNIGKTNYPTNVTGTNDVGNAHWYKTSNNRYALSLYSSARRYKMDIKPVEDSALDPHKLYDINVVQFKFRPEYLCENDPYKDNPYDVIGFVADEVNEKYPIAAIKNDGKVMDWSYRYLLPPMLALIQEQHKRIKTLEKTVEKLMA